VQPSPSNVRSVLFAWCSAGVLYLDALAAAGAPPELVVTGSRASVAAELAAACARLGVPLERRDDPNAPEMLARILALDLILVTGCPRILGPEILAVPRLGALNFHPSRLPDYRGREPLFWALLRGEPTVAITVHHLTAEVDGGPILFQRDVAVPDRATSATLAPLVDRAGVALIPEILALAASGSLPRGTSSSGKGTHYPPLRPEHGLLDFTRSAVEIDRLVRAAAGEIHTYTFFRGLRVIVLEGRPLPAAAGGERPGRVEAVGAAGIDIATAEGAYRAERFLFLDRVHDAPLLAAALSITPGAAFCANPAF
jgi:methionyl-tRNA formyltransferase